MPSWGPTTMPSGAAVTEVTCPCTAPVKVRSAVGPAFGAAGELSGGLGGAVVVGGCVITVDVGGTVMAGAGVVVGGRSVDNGDATVVSVVGGSVTGVVTELEGEVSTSSEWSARARRPPAR